MKVSSRGCISHSRFVVVLCLAGLISLGALVSPVSARTTYISIGTGNVGGVYYALGGAIAEIINKYVPGVNARAEVTGASIENCRLAGRGEIQLGIANADVVYYARNGSEPFTEKHDVWAGFAAYPSTVNIVARTASGIRSIKDMKGKKVSVGAIGSNTYLVAERILEANGLTMKDIAPIYNSVSEAADAMKDGHIDAAFILAATPAAALSELAVTADVRFIPLETAVIEKLVKAYPFYAKGKIPTKSYKGVDVDVQGIQQWNVVVYSGSLSEGLAYEITKAIFEHLDELVAVHQAAKNITLQTAVEVPVDLHPGAKKYFQEAGALK